MILVKSHKVRQKTCVGVLTLLLLCFCISGCSKTGTGDTTEQKREDEKLTAPSELIKEGEETDLSLHEVMDRIVQTKWGNAIDYEAEIENVTVDNLVLLCTSESGKYEAYGCISPEYGKMGIILNNIIDGAPNHNYLEEAWWRGVSKPTLEEQGEYEVIFSFTQKTDGVESERKIYFDTYDTGTMSEREYQNVKRRACDGNF